ncbi:hypothetical protein MOQ72_15270 [Saccharopolyspora sp. K220]|uniref:hypothetical protein n=1 Tax=Saccharopolyspora soli TaxID=2926618 RepID=UPI001F583E86|nr:hypothetical protein [Saccharopolyspora soli]MCI2418801.1 hypothetical protein [Saccharopolyspora soli]
MRTSTKEAFGMFMAFAVLALLAALVLVVLGFQDQRKLWWRFQAMWYANPEANEPSDAAFAVQRVVWFIGAAGLAFGGFQLYSTADDLSLSGGEIKEAAEEVASRLPDDSDGILRDPTDHNFAAYLQDKLRDTDAGGDNGLFTVSQAEDPPPEDTVEQEGQVTVEHYTISAEDAPAVCMTVSATNIGEAYPSTYLPPSYWYALTATVADGSC